MSNREVIMKFTIQGGDLDKTSKQLKQIASDTAAVGREAQKTKTFFEGMLKTGQGHGSPGGGITSGGGFGRPGALSGTNIYGPAGSYSAFTGPRQWQALAASGMANTGSGAGMNWGGGGLTQADLARYPGEATSNRSGMNFARAFGPYARLFGAAGLVGSGFSLAGRAGEYINQTITRPEDRTLGGFAMSVAEDLPILGRGFSVMHDAGGARGAYRRAAAFAGQQASQSDFVGAMQAARSDAAFQMADAQRQLGYARADLAPQAEFATFLKNHQNGQYVTRDVLGVSNEASGQLALARDAARAEALAAQGASARAGNYLTDQGRARDAAQKEMEDAALARNLAQRQVTIEKDKFSKDWSKPFGDSTRLEQATSNAIGLAGVAENKIAEAQRQNAQYAKIAQEANEKRAAAAQKNYEWAKAELEVKKNDLAIGRNLEATVKGGAAQFADLMNGDRDNLIDAAKQAKAQGYQSLSPEQRQLLQSNQITAEFARNSAIESVRNDPQLQELGGIIGVRTDITGIENSNKQLAQNIVAETARINVEFKREVIGNLETAVGQLADTVKDALVATIEKLRTDLEKRLFQDRLSQGAQ